jgi:hypothetical protein
MTFIQMINAVLRRLRENEVVSVSDGPYSKLIGDFVNEAKREVEDAHNWIQLRATIQVTTIPSTFSYALTGAGDRFRILFAMNDTEDSVMKIAPTNWMTENLLISSGPQLAAPMYYDINGQSNGDGVVDVYPVPDGEYNLNFDIVLPQDDFALDGTDDDTLVLINSQPIILGAYAKAISERGDDSGMQFAEAMKNYALALGDGIAIDFRNQPHESVWIVE